jgi:hypothetical protein
MGFFEITAFVAKLLNKEVYFEVLYLQYGRKRD